LPDNSGLILPSGTVLKSHREAQLVNGKEQWPRVAVIGAGAVGGYFGGLLARSGAPVVMIGRAGFVDAVRRDGLLLDTLQFKERVQVEASTELSAANDASLILFCVKTVDNAAVARGLASFVSHQATVISLQNGVDNVEQIRAASGIEALAAVVYVAAAVRAPGQITHGGRGDLVLGPDSAKVQRAQQIFLRAGIPCRISDNIEGELWAKLIWNSALNAVSALGGVTYGRIAEHEPARKLIRATVDELMAVAKAAQVVLPGVADGDAAMEGAMKIASQLPAAFSSTAQDVQRGRKTEIDSLNGYVSRRGAELGVPTPINNTLTALVKLLESRSRSA
jgi:2-dehydropantoate 2-reductase